MDDKKYFAPISGEFRSRQREWRYRRRQAAGELKQLQLLWLVALACFAVYLPVEVLVHASSPPWSQLWPRLGILAVGVTVLLVLRLSHCRRYRDGISSLGLLLAMACYGTLLASRGTAGSGALLLLLLGSYLFSPGGFRLHCLTGVAGSAAAAWLSWPQVPALELSYLLPANILAALALGQFNRSRRRLYLREQRLASLHRRNRSLLYNALPRQIALQLRDNPRRRPVRFVPAATVLFADIVGFSQLARELSPPQLLALLDALFSAFDRLAERHGPEKIKTIGDAYLAVTGLSSNRHDAALQAVLMARAMHSVAARVGRRQQLQLSLRVAVHHGPVVSGVLGSKRYAFDIWGETVNIASRLQAEAEVGGTLVSEAARVACHGTLCLGPPRILELRGCGAIRAAPLLGISASATSRQSRWPLPPQTGLRRRG